LVATCEKREFPWISRPATGKPTGRRGQGFFPFNLFKLATPSRANSFQRLAQSRRRFEVHDPGRPLGAQHTFVHRVITVSLDIANFTILHVDLDAAPAGAHVARCVFNLITHGWGRIDSIRVSTGFHASHDLGATG
jgi:hypothetical protein